MYSFQLKPHSGRPGVSIVEILKNGKVVGAIYPKDDHIKMVSAHFEPVKIEDGFEGQVTEDDGSQGWPPIPSVIVSFSPSAWFVNGDKVIKPGSN